MKTKHSAAKRFRKLPAPRFVAAGAAMIALAAARSALAASCTWDSDTATGGVQDGSGTWTVTGTNWWNGTANVIPAKGTDSLVFGGATAASGTILLNNGGILNYADSTGTSAATFNQNYTINGATANDGLSLGNITIAAGKTVTFNAPIGSLSGGDKNWTLNNGSVLNLAGGGRLQTLLNNGASSSATVNIIGGNWLTGAGSAGATDYSGSSISSVNLGFRANAANSSLAINYTGGNIGGFFILGAVAAGTPVGSTVQMVMDTGTSGIFSLYQNDLCIGEGSAISGGGNISFSLNSGIVSGSTGKYIRIGGRAGLGVANGNGVLTVTSGTIALAGGAGIGLASGTLSTTGTVANSLNINGGLVKTGATGGITLGSANSSTSSGAGSSTTVNIAGGQTYLGTGGLSILSGTTGVTFAVNVSGGTLGALGNWSSSVPITLGTANGPITFTAADDANAAFNISLSGALSGAGGLIKTGGGTLTLSGNNTYSGPTTISAGTLTVGSASALGNGSGNITASGGTLNLGGFTVTSSGTVSFQGGAVSSGTLTNNTVAYDGQSGTVSAVLAGSVGLNKTTAGTLTLSGSNAYSGPTTISSGTLTAGNASALGNGSGNITASGGTLNLSGFTVTTSGTVSFQGGAVSGGTLTNNTITYDGQSGTVSTVLSGSAGLNKTTAGTLTLTGANTFNGGLTLSSGTLTASISANALGAGTLALNGGVLDFNNSVALNFARATTIGGNVKIISEKDTAGPGVTYTLGTLGIGANTLTVESGNVTSGTAGLTFGAATLTGGATFDVASGAGLTLSSVSGNNDFTKQGGGLLTIPGNTSGRTSGITTLTSGTLKMSTATALYSGGAGTLNLNGGTLWMQRDTTVFYANFATILGGDVKFLTDVITSGTAGNTQALAGSAIIGSYTLSIDKGSNVVGGSPLVSLGATILTGNPIFDVASGVALSLGALGDGSSARTLTKINAGTLNLWAAATSLTAGTVVNLQGGTLASTNATALGSNATVNVTGGATSIFSVGASQTISALTNTDGNSADSVVMSGAFTLTVGSADNLSSSFSGVISGPTGALTKAGSGILTLSGSNTYGGNTTISSGTLAIAGSGVLNGGSYSSSIINNGNLTFNSSASQTLSGTISGSGSVTQAGSGSLTLGAVNTYSGATQINAGTLSISGSGTLGNGSGAVTINTGGTLALNSSNSGTLGNPMYIDGGVVNLMWSGTNTLTGNIGGYVTGTLNQSGAGTSILTGNNVFFGPTNISAGVLQLNYQYAAFNSTVTVGVNNGLAFGASTIGIGGISGSGNVALLNGTNAVALSVGANGESTTYSGVLSGAGSLTKAGSGALTLSGSNSYGGNTTISSGTLAIVGSGVLNSGSYSSPITNNGNLTFSSSGAQTLSGVISGSGSVTQAGSGNLTLRAVNTFSGGFTLSSGTLTLGNNSVFGSSTGTLNMNGGIVELSGSNLLYTTANPTQLNADFTVGSAATQGTMQWAISGTSTLTANRTITVNGGALNISGGLSDGGNGYGFTKTGSGLLRLSGTGSYTGDTKVAAGTLTIFSALAAQTSVLDTSGAGTFLLNPGTAVTLGGLKGGGAFAVGSTLNSITLNNGAGVSCTYSGIIFNGAAGAMAVTKTGNGTQALSGSNSYTGGTSIQAGTLVAGNANALGSGALTVNAGTLDLHGFSTGIGALSGSSGSLITNSVSGTATLTIGMASGTSIYAGNIVNGAGSIVLTNSGAGTLILSGLLSMAGLNANNGITQLAQSGSIGAVSIASGAALSMPAHSGSTYNVLDTNSLSITPGGSIDLWNNAMVLRASGTAENATNLTTVKAAVNAASNGLQWNGTGLGSTTAFNEAGLGKTQALAVMVYDNTVIKQSSFEGVSGLGYFDSGSPVGFNQVLVKLTYLGDFNADGIINASDYTWLDGFALGGDTLGDLNGDGVVNATDYTWLDGSALNQSFGLLAAQHGGGSGVSPLQATAAQASSEGTAPTTPEAVPEPGMLGLLLAAGLATLGRRGGRKYFQDN